MCWRALAWARGAGVLGGRWGVCCAPLGTCAAGASSWRAASAGALPPPVCLLAPQGQAALRGHQGSGTVVAGYRRIITHDDTLDVTAVVGLRTLFSLTSSRQLSPYSSAALTGTWNAEEGVGLQLQTSRQLFNSSQGSFTWVVGPSAASSMGLALSHRAKK